MTNNNSNLKTLIEGFTNEADGVSFTFGNGITLCRGGLFFSSEDVETSITRSFATPYPSSLQIFNDAQNRYELEEGIPPTHELYDLIEQTYGQILSKM